MKKDGVNQAFQILLEEIETVTLELNDTGTRAFQQGDYEAAREAADKAALVIELREKIRALQEEWTRLLSGNLRKERKKVRRKIKRRLSHGLCTTEKAFRRPILEALVELGGSAPANTVLDRVEQKMKPVLNEYDYQRIPSDPKLERWRKAAQWCRYTLVKEGLMRSDSPRGIWEISEAGRKELLKWE